MQELIDLGAVTLLVPGILPIGCSPSYLTKYETEDTEEYDPETGCLTKYNKLAEYHNEQLQKELQSIQALNPQTNIIYADYYNASMGFFRSPAQYGNSIFLIIFLVSHIITKIDWILLYMLVELLLEKNEQ